MKDVWKLSAAAVTFAGAALCISTPAAADVGFGISIGVPGAITFDYGSGGYCDRWGCPDGYWDYPIWYGPVYYGGMWYQGPVYYREWGGARWFWVHGSWHRDEWRGPRPGWWSSSYHYGPALGFGYYHEHGFTIPRRHWDYWHGHGGYDWERRHGVDWRRDYGGHDRRDRGWDRDRRDRDHWGGRDHW